MTAYEAGYRDDVEHPSHEQIREHLRVRQRMAFAAGAHIPSDRTAYCPGCRKTVRLVNVRAWPMMGGDCGECEHCGSTLMADDRKPAA